jgi:hypothetical protein
VTDAQLRAVRSYGAFDVVSRALRVGNDLCADAISDPFNGIDLSDPNVFSDGNCYFGGQLDPNTGDCAITASTGARRLCPCSQFAVS